MKILIALLFVLTTTYSQACVLEQLDGKLSQSEALIEDIFAMTARGFIWPERRHVSKENEKAIEDRVELLRDALNIVSKTILDLLLNGDDSSVECEAEAPNYDDVFERFRTILEDNRDITIVYYTKSLWFNIGGDEDMIDYSTLAPYYTEQISVEESTEEE